jgi:hypothetical protein
VKIKEHSQILCVTELKSYATFKWLQTYNCSTRVEKFRIGSIQIFKYIFQIFIYKLIRCFGPASDKLNVFHAACLTT